jgi:BlaI family penicillinase repressor
MALGDRDLGDAELDVMRALWDLGPSPVRDVMRHLHARGRRVAYTTVLTFLTRLEHKGLVASDRSERAYVYRARVSRRRVQTSRLRALVSQLYDGAAGELVLHLVQSGRVSPGELAELHRLIERLEAENRARDG